MGVQKKVIVIAGPTASGKTGLAIKLAESLGTEIISADSRQCYKELSIGVARPSEQQLSQVPHHFVASHSIHEKVSAGLFEQYALKKAREIFAHKDLLVMAGGTGLYIDAFCNGIDEMPEVDSGIREALIADYNSKGLPWLQQVVKEKDFRFFQQGEIHNPQRLMRALEIFMSTGKSILDFKKGAASERPFEVIKIALGIEKKLLHQNIDTRVEAMMKEGLLAEAEALYQFQHLTALNTVGYKELFGFIKKEWSLDKAVALIKTHTRQYAKRQVTWFKKDSSYKWISNPEDAYAVVGVEP